MLAVGPVSATEYGFLGSDAPAVDTEGLSGAVSSTVIMRCDNEILIFGESSPGGHLYVEPQSKELLYVMHLDTGGDPEQATLREQTTEQVGPDTPPTHTAADCVDDSVDGGGGPAFGAGDEGEQGGKGGLNDSQEKLLLDAPETERHSQELAEEVEAGDTLENRSGLVALDSSRPSESLYTHSSTHSAHSVNIDSSAISISLRDIVLYCTHSFFVIVTIRSERLVWCPRRLCLLFDSHRRFVGLNYRTHQSS